ncbi:M48 metallopeptidase family protein [Nocardioides antri]|uniref:M48 family metallopeptidase n=1 Tax=Nocardioides antri TaxID=2607659 RepID=A0A5B1M2B7_9ACTN|nr:M48 family metallopeptidase [Nocardioides antri]KAA1426924.1 M48 family metallopeptidase [Nocardioides antri]
MSEPAPRVEVRRSGRRRRTVSAYVEDDRIVVLVPDNLSKAEERDWVRKMVARLQRREQRDRRTDDGLMARARELSDRYLGGLAEPVSVTWVANQRSRWGSCSPGDRTIRLSERLQKMPDWVVDYVLIHELAHLIEPGHNAAFWGWVGHYPHTEKAKGYLLGWSEAARLDPPPGDDVDEGVGDVD